MRESIPDAAAIWTEDDARRALEAWRRSGDSLAAFARRHGLTPERLYWWRRRLATAVAPPPARLSLVPATVVVADEAGIAIRLPSGVTIEVASASPTWVAAVVSELARSPT